MKNKTIENKHETSSIKNKNFKIIEVRGSDKQFYVTKTLPQT